MRDIIVERKKQGLGEGNIWQLKVNDKVVATLRNGKSVTLSADPKKKYTIQCFYEATSFFGCASTVISDIVNIPANSNDYKLIATSMKDTILLEIEDNEEE